MYAFSLIYYLQSFLRTLPTIIAIAAESFKKPPLISTRDGK